MARADRIKAILAQKERDDNISRLLETMSDGTLDRFPFLRQTAPRKHPF